VPPLKFRYLCRTTLVRIPAARCQPTEQRRQIGDEFRAGMRSTHGSGSSAFVALPRLESRVLRFYGTQDHVIPEVASLRGRPCAVSGRLPA